ncbi:blue light sensor protein [Stenotrophomonas maltophilia]|nr:blue light sensor protein [Stenotrophomonas maltophilia]
MRAGREFNAKCGSRAVVCFDGSRFLTYLEGTASAVAASSVYTQSFTLHTEIVELARGSIQQLRFLSYLEGPPDGLRVAYARASEVRSHLNFIELARGRVSQRRLPRWPMRLFLAKEGQLQSIAMADWASFSQRGDADAMNSTAMDLLVRFAESRSRPN